MASLVDAAWYFEGSGVPVGWNEGAVAFKVVPLVSAWPFVVGVATGAIVGWFFGQVSGILLLHSGFYFVQEKAKWGQSW